MRSVEVMQSSYRVIRLTYTVRLSYLIRQACLSTVLLWLSLPCAADSGKVRILETLNLGGVEQTILIRGDSSDKPILLFLHGGPGVTEMPVAHVEKEMEHDFLVVQWDQRGAGKSYHPGIPRSAMRVENFVEDTEALSRYLLARFEKRKLYLVGYSWGSLIGALTASRSPDLFYSYIGLSQLVNVPMSDQMLYEQTLTRARERSDWKSFNILRKLGPPPFANAADKAQASVLARKLAGAVPHRFTSMHYAEIALFSPYYSIVDDAKLLRGMTFSHQALTQQIHEANLFAEVPRLNLPVYFFAGRYDIILSPVLLEQYYRALVAPRGKHLIWFEHSAHGIQIEEREKYHAALREVLRETSGGNSALRPSSMASAHEKHEKQCP